MTDKTNYQAIQLQVALDTFGKTHAAAGTMVNFVEQSMKHCGDWSLIIYRDKIIEKVSKLRQDIEKYAERCR